MIGKPRPTHRPGLSVFWGKWESFTIIARRITGTDDCVGLPCEATGWC